MKTIRIYQENSEHIDLLDKDDSDLVTYTKKISEILESTKICILETTSGVLSIKPSKINSILVDELHEKEIEIEKEPVHIDIIKD